MKNVGKTDKIIRIIIAIAAFYAYGTGAVTGNEAYIALAIGIIMAATALMNFCPLFKIFNISSCGKCCKEGKCDKDAE